VFGLMAKKKATKPRPPAKESAPEPEPTTIAGLAAAIGIRKRRLQDYFEAGCPRGPIEAIREWRASNIDAKSTETVLSPLTRLKKRKLRVDIREREIRTAKLEEKMILREDAERVLADLCIAIKNELEKLPDAIEMEIPRQHRATLKRAIAHRINQTLLRMATWTI
jgi:hypothetical protein